MIDFEHLLSVTLDVKRQGVSEWRELSRRERAFVALALNRADWLVLDELSLAQAISLVRSDLIELVPAVEQAINQ